MPTLNDLWQAWLGGDAATTRAQIIGRPSLTSFESPTLSAPTLVRAGSSQLLSYNIFNPNTAVAFVQLFNAATVGAVTLGTTQPAKQLAVPPGAVLDGTWDFGPAFPLGIVMAVTTAQKGATAPTTGLSVSLGVL